jgi:hypothetical protein
MDSVFMAESKVSAAKMAALAEGNDYKKVKLLADHHAMLRCCHQTHEPTTYTEGLSKSSHEPSVSSSSWQARRADSKFTPPLIR